MAVTPIPDPTGKRYCVNCIHHINLYEESHGPYAKIIGHGCKQFRDPITGDPLDCVHARGHTSLCAWEGYSFEDARYDDDNVSFLPGSQKR